MHMARLVISCSIDVKMLVHSVRALGTMQGVASPMTDFRDLPRNSRLGHHDACISTPAATRGIHEYSDLSGTDGNGDTLLRIFRATLFAWRRQSTLLH
jgi:hypothetical protein